jgi:hypothetical protein
VTDWPLDTVVIEYRLQCYVNGIPRILTAFPSRSIAVGQRTTCPLEFADAIELEASRTAANVRVGCVTTAGILWYPFARGYFLFEQSQAGPRRNKGSLVDCTWKLAQESVNEITWNDRSPVDAITDVLTEADFADSEIGNIFDPGSIYNLGTVDEIIIEAGTTLKQVFDRLLKYCGLTWYVGASGALHVIPALTIPGSSSSIVYASGISNEFALPADTRGFAKPKRRYTSDELQTKTYTAKGRTLEDGTTPNATLTASDIERGISKGDTYEYAQDNDVCTAIVKRELRRASGKTELLTLETDLDPRLRPGRTIGLLCPELQFDVTTYARIQALSNRGGICTLSVTLGTSAVGGDVTYEPPPDDNGDGGTLTPIGGIEGELPTASIAYRIDYEKTSSGDPLYTVYAEGSGTSATGESVTYSWTATAGAGETVTPGSSSEQNETFVFSSLTGASLELTVTDSNGTSPAATLTLDDPTIETYSRILTYVIDDTWKVLYDPDQPASTWQPSGTVAIAVPRYNDAGHLWCVFFKSATTETLIYRRDPQDFAETPELIATLSGTPTRIYVGEGFINPQFANTILVGIGSTIAYSRNGESAAPTFQTTASLGTGTIQALVVSAFDDDLWYACIDNKLRKSEDGGATWSDVVTSPDASAVAEDVAIGPAAGGAVAFSGASTDARRVQFVDAGFSTDWSAITFAAGEDLQTITPRLAGDGYQVASSDGTVYELILSGTTFTASEQAQTDASGNAERMVRDGEIANQSYIADATGLYKQQGASGMEQIAAGVATSVGFAALREPPVVPSYTFFLAQQGVASAGIYEYNSATGGTPTLRNSGIPAALTHVLWLSGNPINTDELIAVIHASAAADVSDSGGKLRTGTTTHSPLWRYTISTQTWSEIVVSVSSTVSGNLYRADYDPETLGRWVSHVESTGYDVYALFGTDLTGSETTVAATSPLRYLSVGPGQDGDLVLNQNAPFDRIAYVTSGGTLVEPSASGILANVWFFGDRYPGSRDMVLASDGGAVYAKEDYRGTALPVDFAAEFPLDFVSAATWPSASSSSGSRTIPTTINNRFVYAAGSGGPTASGIYEVTNPFSASPGYDIVALSGETIGWIRADRATNSLVALMLDFSGTPEVAIWNGATIERVDVSALSNIAALVEVVVND